MEVFGMYHKDLHGCWKIFGSYDQLIKFLFLIYYLGYHNRVDQEIKVEDKNDGQICS